MSLDSLPLKKPCLHILVAENDHISQKVFSAILQTKNPEIEINFIHV